MTAIALLPNSVETVGFPITVEGVDRATLETFVAKVAVLPWSSTEPPPIPDTLTTWETAGWDTFAAVPTVVALFGPGEIALTEGVSYRAYVQIVGGGQSVEADAGTIVCGLSATYSGNPATSARDAVRFALGDVTAPFQLSNAEIDYALDGNVSTMSAAADLAEALAARYANEAEQESVGDVSITRKRAQAYRELAAMLRSRVLVSPGTGGVRFRVGTGDEAPAAFWIAQHDHPEAPARPRRGLTT